jgi:hypothetical protein
LFAQRRIGMIIVAETPEEHQQLLAIADRVPEFSIYDRYGPAYVRNLVRKCRCIGIDANWFVPTGTLELWLGCMDAKQFIEEAGEQ